MRRRLYRFSHSRIGRLPLRALAPLVTIDREPPPARSRHPFLVVVTVDTEAGFVGSDERRVWQKDAPGASVGFLAGVANAVEVLARHSAPATFLVSTHAFASAGPTARRIRRGLLDARALGHELGLHLHPDSDAALQRRLGRRFRHTSAFELDDDDKEPLVRGALALFQEGLDAASGAPPTSFRWGNWALDATAARAIAAAGFTVDSSAVPGLGRTRGRGARFDWRRVRRHAPWPLNLRDHQSTEPSDSPVLEIPNATFRLLGRSLRADPIYSTLLHAAFLRYLHEVDRSHEPFPFVVMTHSSECTTERGAPTTSLRSLDAFLAFAAEHEDVRFTTLDDAARRVLAARAADGPSGRSRP